MLDEAAIFKADAAEASGREISRPDIL